MAGTGGYPSISQRSPRSDKSSARHMEVTRPDNMAPLCQDPSVVVQCLKWLYPCDDFPALAADMLWNAVLEYWPLMDKAVSRIEYIGSRHSGAARVRHVRGALAANERLYHAFAEGRAKAEAVRDLVDEKVGTVIHPGGQCLSGGLQFQTWMRILGRPEQPVCLETGNQCFHANALRVLANDSSPWEPIALKAFLVQAAVCKTQTLAALFIYAATASVPGFLTPDEAEYFASLASEDLGTSAGDLGFPGAAVLLQTLVEPVTPTARQIEERLTNWNEFAPENLGYLRLVRANTQIGMGNRGCGQRSATICLSEQADVHFPHIGVRIAMSRGDLLEWPNAWFQEEAASNPKEKVTVEDLRTTHVHLAPSLMLDASFHDKPVRTADGEKDSRPPK
eukprot:s632_g2.t1